MFRMSFQSWRQITVELDNAAIETWLNRTGAAIQSKFESGLRGEHSGVKHPSLPNQSSAPGEYPAYQSGRLWQGTSKSLAGMSVTGASVEVGSTAPHATYLMGTRKMAKRKMFDNAIQEAERPMTPRFAVFRMS